MNLSTRTKPRAGNAGARNDALGRLAQLTGADLKIEHLPIGSLVPYARNPRTHTEAQVAQIAASIREFGWLFSRPLSALIIADDSIGRFVSSAVRIIDRKSCAIWALALPS